MKLVLYSHFFAPSVGGVETIVASLAHGLAELRVADKREFEVTVVTQTAAGGFNDGGLPFAVVRRPSLTGLRRLVRWADVVHVAGPALAPMFLAWIARKPYIVEHHGYQAICPNGLLVHQPERSVCPGHFQAGRYGACVRCQAKEMSWFRSIEQVMLEFVRCGLAKRAAANIAVSEHVSGRIALPRSRVIYHGIENTGRRRYGSPGGDDISGKAKVRFAYSGRLVPEKGLVVLLEAARILRGERLEFELLLVGDGPERGFLENEIARLKLGDCARVTGFLEGAKLEEVMATVDAVVVPSVWEETAGLAAIEQMMRGRVVIASRIGGLAEMIGDAGLLCMPGDAEDLARCMREVLADPGRAAEFGVKARERAGREFSSEKMVEGHAGLCQKAFSGSDENI